MSQSKKYLFIVYNIATFSHLTVHKNIPLFLSFIFIYLDFAMLSIKRHSKASKRLFWLSGLVVLFFFSAP